MEKINEKKKHTVNARKRSPLKPLPLLGLESKSERDGGRELTFMSNFQVKNSKLHSIAFHWTSHLTHLRKRPLN
jgi:hypothetical protein